MRLLALLLSPFLVLVSSYAARRVFCWSWLMTPGSCRPQFCYSSRSRRRTDRLAANGVRFAQFYNTGEVPLIGREPAQRPLVPPVGMSLKRAAIIRRFSPAGLFHRDDRPEWHLSRNRPFRLSALLWPSLRRDELLPRRQTFRLNGESGPCRKRLLHDHRRRGPPSPSGFIRRSRWFESSPDIMPFAASQSGITAKYLRPLRCGLGCHSYPRESYETKPTPCCHPI